MNLRKNQNSLTVADKQAFAQAMLARKQKPSRLHRNDSGFGRYDDFVEVHLNAMMPPMMSPPLAGWAHQSPVFMPWHRVLLLELEKELQTLDPAVTIPYWDWTQAARGQPADAADGKSLGQEIRNCGVICAADTVRRQSGI